MAKTNTVINYIINKTWAVVNWAHNTRALRAEMLMNSQRVSFDHNGDVIGTRIRSHVE